MSEKLSFYPITKTSFFVLSTFGKTSHMIPNTSKEETKEVPINPDTGDPVTMQDLFGDDYNSAIPINISVTDCAGNILSQFTIPDGSISISRLRTIYLPLHLGNHATAMYTFIINDNPTTEVPHLWNAERGGRESQYTVEQYADSCNHVKLTMIPSKHELLLQELFCKIRSNEESVFRPLIQKTLDDLAEEFGENREESVDTAEDRLIDIRQLYFPYLSDEGEVIPGLLTELICEYNDIDPADLYDYISVEDPEIRERLEETHSRYKKIVSNLTKAYPESEYRRRFGNVMAEFITNYVNTLPYNPEDYEFNSVVASYLE